MTKIGVTISDLDDNPTLSSENSEKSISFYQTRETLYSPELYNKFIHSAVNRFHKSNTYSMYKGRLIEMGMNRDFIQSNLSMEHCSIEMHHNVLTVYDIAFIICEHTLNTVGKISSFDLVEKLKEEHKNNRVGLVMLSVTSHELYHANDDFYIHPNMVIGRWYEFLEKYNRGITPQIANKVIRYINTALNTEKSTDAGLLKLRDNIYDWSQY